MKQAITKATSTPYTVLVCLLISSCGVHRMPAVTAPTAGTLPATRPQAAPAPKLSPCDGLVRLLSRPYWTQRENDWRRFFARGFFGGPFDVEGRDRIVAGLVSEVDALAARADARLAIIEHIGGGMYGTYERVVIISGMKPGGRLGTLAEMPFTTILPAPWRPLGELLDQWVRIGGNGNGCDRLYDATDAVVLTYFDGQRWWAETWFCISSLDFATDLRAEEHKTATLAQLPASMRLYAEVLQHINRRLGVPFQEDIDLIDVKPSTRRPSSTEK